MTLAIYLVGLWLLSGPVLLAIAAIVVQLEGGQTEYWAHQRAARYRRSAEQAAALDRLLEAS